MKKNFRTFLSFFVSIVAFLALSSSSCDKQQQISDSGVKKTTVKVQTDENGQTIEQINIVKRLSRDNKVGSIKHLYVISSYTGDVLEYSTVVGKVTSGNKRLSPKNVSDNPQFSNMYVVIGEKSYATSEVLDDGGTYGESSNYIFWFDSQDNYHQYFPSGGTYLHISDKPLRIRKSNFSVELN